MSSVVKMGVFKEEIFTGTGNRAPGTSPLFSKAGSPWRPWQLSQEPGPVNAQTGEQLCHLTPLSQPRESENRASGEQLAAHTPVCDKAGLQLCSNKGSGG